MSGFLSTFSKVIPRNFFRIALNVVERTAPQIQVNHRKICNGCSLCSNVSANKLPDMFPENNEFYIKSSSTVPKIISTPNFPDASKIGEVTLIKRPREAVNLYDIIMRIETDKSFVYVSAPSDGTIAEVLVADGDTVRPGQELIKFVSTPAANKGVTNIETTIPPPVSRNTVKIIAAPQFPDSSNTGIVKWMKPKNASIDAYEIILRIETDKTFIYVPAPTSGTIIQALVKDGDQISPGQNLFKFDLKQSLSKPPESKKEHSHDPIQISPDQQPRSMKSNDLNILPQITNTNPTGHRVTVNKLGSKKSGTTESANARDVLTTVNEIDMGNIILWRKQNLKAIQEKYGTKFGFMAIFCKACSYALKDLPRFNAFINGSDIVYHNYADISVAVPTPKGYVLPVLRNVESMDCVDIAKKIETFSKKVQTSELATEDVKSGTFTITNAGKFGSLMGTPVVTPPKSTVLGMHGIFDRPVAYKGKIDIRPMMYVALTYDHRLFNGHDASLFLNKVKNSLEEPSKIVACTKL